MVAVLFIRPAASPISLFSLSPLSGSNGIFGDVGPLAVDEYEADVEEDSDWLADGDDGAGPEADDEDDAEPDVLVDAGGVLTGLLRLLLTVLIAMSLLPGAGRYVVGPLPKQWPGQTCK